MNHFLASKASSMILNVVSSVAILSSSRQSATHFCVTFQIPIFYFCKDFSQDYQTSFANRHTLKVKHLPEQEQQEAPV